MNKFEVFVLDRREKMGISPIMSIYFLSLFDESIRKVINKFTFKGTDQSGENAFIPSLPFIIKINDREIDYFDWKYEPFYFD